MTSSLQADIRNSLEYAWVLMKNARKQSRRYPFIVDSRHILRTEDI